MKIMKETLGKAMVFASFEVVAWPPSWRRLIGAVRWIEMSSSRSWPRPQKIFSIPSRSQGGGHVGRFDAQHGTAR